jgi:hypothetical protein
MKFLCVMITAVLLMHLQCGAFCVGDTFRSAAKQEQPCHKQSNTPQNLPDPSNEAAGRCGQGSVLEAKLAFASKDMLTVIVAVIPLAANFTPTFETFLPSFRAVDPPGSHSALAPSILRI